MISKIDYQESHKYIIHDDKTGKPDKTKQYEFIKSKCYTFTLASGSLFIMSSPCQDLYLHCIEADPNCDEDRINLTYRLFDKFRYAGR